MLLPYCGPFRPSPLAVRFAVFRVGGSRLLRRMFGVALVQGVEFPAVWARPRSR
jgi:hypothetical protein